MIRTTSKSLEIVRKALKVSGYHTDDECDDILSATYKGKTSRGDDVYQITFENPESGTIDHGRVYVKDGRGEF